jgi:SIR2-like domain
LPELIQNGPNIPVELMNRRDDGNVVFFCGAGISVGTGLPNFGDLVTDVYARTGQTPTLLEKDLLKRSQFDKVLGLLEERLNPGRLRREVVARLSEPPNGGLDVHEALPALSRTVEDGIRLVTTTFDDRFERAGHRQMPIDAAPKLPIPKSHDWTSVVHLHGRIQLDDDGSHLVLTAADFGRAYLTERWAARFITELFREFTVVFVGYSLNDPVLSYMVDALAAERSRGARFEKAYAFADHKGG